MASNSTSWMNGSSWSPSDTNTKIPFDDSNGDPFDDRYATPLQDIETGTTARPSGETQQREAVDQSGVLSEEKRIIEDIRNERLSCEVCLEPVRFAKDRYLWNCKSCHAVTHHRCTVLWAKANPVGRALAWKCPKCENIERSRPKKECWCGKGSPLHDHPTIPNACFDGICGSKSKCAHGNKSSCRKPCHPGPCKYECGRCANDRLPNPANMNTISGRFKSKRLNFCTIFFKSMLIVALFGGICTFISFHIKWHTQPYLYPRFKGSLSFVEGLCLLVAGIFYLPFGALYCINCLKGGSKFFLEILNGNPLHTGYKFRFSRTLIGVSLLTCFLVGLYAIPIIGIVGGPDIQWYNQMKDSCHGFDTRVEIGTRFAASTYTLYSLNDSVNNQTFYLAPVLAPKFGSKEPYQYFHRFSGSTTNTANFAIDVDIDNGVWRELHFNGTDELTKWWASGRKQYPSAHPIFDNITTTEGATKLNGTFVIRDGHLWMPDFDLIIQGLEDSRKHAEIEPFIRVFDTEGLPHSRTEKLLSPRWNWNNRHDPSIVMRTASFGHGRQRLDMCIKENFYYSSNREQQKLDGVSDGSIMPLAVIATFRMRMNEMYALNSGRPFNVKKKSGYDDVKAIA
ncbi:hypothetical protein BTUL_0087g00140 [Botrytis tulipae]|uniref:PHD-type domain-containing protein n=1 Tax=Botrytis tulipae TaxID=87230 RepID=A0A4Z1ETK8_9HELO|nr:hypothetical protein BTUL_0087g00140 [Botrytis tulipae]